MIKLKAIILIIPLIMSGCDLVSMDPTNQIMLEMREDIDHISDRLDDGIDVRLAPQE